MSKTSVLEKFYNFINIEDKEPNCDGISSEACDNVPRNYFIIFISSLFTKLGDTLSNPKTVLTWLMGYVNAPVYLISFIVPIRESGSMLPQILIANYVKTKAIRKWIWVIGSLFQFVSIALIGVVSLFFTGVIAGYLVIVFLILFSISRSLCSVTSKDITGKSIPKKKRGKLKGYISSISGVLVLIAGLFIAYKSKENVGIYFYASIIFFASLLWLFAAIVYANIKEFSGETISNKESLKDAFASISLLKTDKTFRNFIISRSLLLCSALSAPFYVLLAQRSMGEKSFLLGLFIVANGLASILSGPFWGIMADKASNKVMSYASLLASSLGTLVFLIITFLPKLQDFYWLYPIIFFVLGIAHSGVRLGRKTYILDIAEGNKRTDYVAISNTIIGFILLITGGITALASSISIEIIILILSVFGFIGALTSYKLPNVQKT